MRYEFLSSPLKYWICICRHTHMHNDKHTHTYIYTLCKLTMSVLRPSDYCFWQSPFVTQCSWNTSRYHLRRFVTLLVLTIDHNISLSSYFHLDFSLIYTGTLTCHECPHWVNTMKTFTKLYRDLQTPIMFVYGTEKNVLSSVH